MKDWTEDKLEKFIKENKDEFNMFTPKETHEEKFFTKLQSRVREFIDLTPYIVKVTIITVVLFIGSYLIWNNFIRADKNKPIIESIVEQFQRKK